MTFVDDIKTRLFRIIEEDPALGAFIRVDADEALSAAARADLRKSKGEVLGPLDGLAIAVKDNLAVAGKPLTAGIAGRRGLITDADATAVKKLRDAGAILIGATNMDEGALGALTDNPTFGRCVNPLGAGLTPGGSSGGSAAAVAAGFADIALGTDTMGSVRVPAAYCGITGIKPTLGAIDRNGLLMLCPTLDTIGPMARDARLLRPTLAALARSEAKEHWSGCMPTEGLHGIRFGVPVQLQSVDCEPAILSGLERARHAITRLGGVVQDIDISGWSPRKSRRAGLLAVEAEGAHELEDLIDEPGSISDHFLSMLSYGRDAPSEKVAVAYAEVERAGDAANLALTSVEAILMPTTPQRAFSHGTTVPPNQADLTALANFAGCPALTLPVVLPREPLPASIQLIGPRWSDMRLLSWADCLADPLADPI